MKTESVYLRRCETNEVNTMETQTRFASYVNIKADVKPILVLVMCSVYMIQFLSGSRSLNLIVGILAIIVFLSSVSSAKLITRFFGLAMFSTGVVLNLWKGGGWQEIALGVVANLPLLTLVTLVPMLSIPLKIGGYFRSIHYFMEKMDGIPGRLFASLSFFLFSMGPILNLGSVRVLHDMIGELQLESKFLAKSYMVGFSTVMLWSPYFASVAMVLYYLDVSIYTYLPLGISFAFLQWVIGNALFRLEHRISSRRTDSVQYEKHETQQNPDHTRMMWKLLGILLFLMSSIFIIEYVTHWPMLFLVSTIAVLFPIAWCILHRKWTAYRSHFTDFKKHSVPMMNNEILLFLSAGLFGQALVGTTFADGIRMMLNHLAEISLYLFIISVIAAVFVSTFVGIHPIVVVTLLITQMEPSVIGVTPHTLALLFMISWSVSAVAGPVNPVNLLVSASVNASPLEVGLKWNGLYLLSMVIIGSLFVYILNI
jgi:hypothetical protein